MFIVRVLFTILFSILLMGCKEENPTPELSDPIYMDIMTKIQDLKAHVEEHRKQMESWKEVMSHMGPRDPNLRNFMDDHRKILEETKKYKQLLAYYEIRLQRRKITARKKYKQSLSKKTPWPDQEEYEHYKTNIRLREASRNWDDRVPTLSLRYIEKAKPAVNLEEDEK